MLHKIFLDNGFSGEHMGLVFVNGEAHTEDAFLASRLRGKGYTVTAEAGGFTPLDLERMTVAQLREYAEAGDIDLGSARTKAEIISAIIAEMSDDVPEPEAE